MTSVGPTTSAALVPVIPTQASPSVSVTPTRLITTSRPLVSSSPPATIASVAASDASDSSSSTTTTSSNVGPIAGGVVGGLFALVLLVLFALWFRRRRANRRASQPATWNEKRPHDSFVSHSSGSEASSLDGMKAIEVTSPSMDYADGERDSAAVSIAYPSPPPPSRRATVVPPTSSLPEEDGPPSPLSESPLPFAETTPRLPSLHFSGLPPFTAREKASSLLHRSVAPVEEESTACPSPNPSEALSRVGSVKRKPVPRLSVEPPTPVIGADSE